MKVQGFDGDLKGVGALVIARGDKKLSLRLRALPFGYEQEVTKEIPPPTPPRKGWARDKNGRLLKDERGKPVPDYDYENAEYQEKQTKVNGDHMILGIIMGLAADSNVQFDARREDFKTTEEYIDAVREELKEFGFTTWDIVAISREVMKLSGATEEQLSAARSDFSQKGQEGAI